MIIKWLLGALAVPLLLFVAPSFIFGINDGKSIGDMAGVNRLLSADRRELLERCSVAFQNQAAACDCFVNGANAAKGRYTPNMSRDYIYDHIPDGQKNLAEANLMLMVNWQSVPKPDRDVARAETQSIAKACFKKAE